MSSVRALKDCGYAVSGRFRRFPIKVLSGLGSQQSELVLDTAPVQYL